MGDGRSSPRLAAPNVQDAKRAVSSPVRCRGPGPRTTRRVAWRPPARVAAKQAQRAQGGFSCLAPIHALLRQTRQRMDCYGNANAGVASQPLSIISIPWQSAAPQVRNLDQAGEQMTARRLAQLRAGRMAPRLLPGGFSAAALGRRFMIVFMVASAGRP